MADKITNQTQSNIDVSRSRAPKVSRPDQGGDSGSGAKATESRDAVELTQTATNLKRIEAKLASVPDVDASRVDDVRQRMDAGSYEVDHQEIAQKLLKLDQDLS